MPLWPIHPKPKKDELLSSWITRLSMANTVETKTFYRNISTAAESSFREMDRAYDPSLMQILAEGVGIPIEDVWQTDLPPKNRLPTVT